MGKQASHLMQFTIKVAGVQKGNQSMALYKPGLHVKNKWGGGEADGYLLNRAVVSITPSIVVGNTK